jgi:transposase InsO family protein
MQTWKKLEQADRAFDPGSGAEARAQKTVDDLYAEIGQLTVERGFLAKRSGNTGPQSHARSCAFWTVDPTAVHAALDQSNGCIGPSPAMTTTISTTTTISSSAADRRAVPILPVPRLATDGGDAVGRGTLAAACIRISTDGRGRWMDNVFIERLWRSLKYEDVYLKGYADGREAKAGTAPTRRSATARQCGLWCNGVEGCRLDGQGQSVAHMPTAATAADSTPCCMISRGRSGRVSNLENRFPWSRMRVHLRSRSVKPW